MAKSAILNKSCKVYIRHGVVHITLKGTLFAPPADRNGLRETVAEPGRSYPFLYADRDCDRDTIRLAGTEEYWVPVLITKDGAVPVGCELESAPESPEVNEELVAAGLAQEREPVEPRVVEPARHAEPDADPPCYEGLNVINARVVARSLFKSRVGEPKRLKTLAEDLVEANPGKTNQELAPALARLAKATYSGGPFTALHVARTTREEATKPSEVSNVEGE